MTKDLAVLESVLNTLDHADDAHWTKGGLPDVNYVKEQCGYGVTRDMINDMAPDLVREGSAAADVPDDSAQPDIHDPDIEQGEIKIPGDLPQADPEGLSIMGDVIEDLSPKRANERVLKLRQIITDLQNILIPMKGKSGSLTELQNAASRALTEIESNG